MTFCSFVFALVAFCFHLAFFFFLSCFFSFLGPEPAFSAWKTNWLPEMKQAELYPQHNQNPTAGKKKRMCKNDDGFQFSVEHPHVGVCMFHIQHE